MSYLVNPEKVAEHLSGVVKFKTLSCDKEADCDFEPFFKMHQYLEQAYPLVHKNLKKEVIGKAALLYTWKGTGKSNAKPIVFMAHQDVVPEGDHSCWTYPPYSGEIVDGQVWGRGSSDCKSNMIAQLEVVEYLLSQGFTPDYDIYLAYGYNEEVAGGDSASGARLIAETLIARGVRCGYAFDEGGGVKDGKQQNLDTNICSITVAEKGYADFEISRKDPGGHSSRPHKDGALDYVAKAILAIAANQYPYRITEAVAQRYQAMAPYMTDNKELAELLKDVKGNWEKLLPYIDEDPSMAAFFHTTMVPTMAKGSDQGNILPEKASIVVNCRLLAPDTVEEVKAHIESIIPEGMEVNLVKGNNPSPFSDINSEGAQLIFDIAKELYGDNMMLMPEVMLGGTDAKFFYDACDYVYRYTFSNRKTKSVGNAHAVNETMPYYDLTESLQYYVEFIKRYGK